MKKVRCSIYTRKSSEEGLEQDFNSLDAQREACAAYILSQVSEGWSLVREQYDDGGVSGGSLERPALQRLLADVAAGDIDIIVVYKVDRLTRSLLDFAKLVEAFDKAGTSFVSVTQSFNTTTSMGRLTLNMLLSFAQFEREVTAERIRDKIAASKAKGMWMGGTPPLGYEPNGRSLAIIEEDAEIVRDIYRRYISLGNVRVVAAELKRDGVRAPVRISGTGRKFGGQPFSKGNLYAILKNPIYMGKIRHGGEIYPGQHAAIMDRETWEQAQERLKVNLRGERRARGASASSLAGLIVDASGEPLVPVHACKRKVRYRYYVSRALQHGGLPNGHGIRVPAREVEGVVIEQLARLLENPIELARRLSFCGSAGEMQLLSDACRGACDELRKPPSNLVTRLVSQVSLRTDSVEVLVRLDGLCRILGIRVADASDRTFTLSASVRLTRSGRVMRLVQPDGSAAAPLSADPMLVRLIVKARKWWAILAAGQHDVPRLAAEYGITPAYVTRIVRAAFLAPEVVEAILQNQQDVGVSVGILTSPHAIDADWNAQAASFLGWSHGANR